MTIPLAVLEAIKQALALDPRNHDLWIHYAELLQQSEQTSEAANALRSASSLDPNSAKILCLLLPLLRKSDQLSEALIRAEDFLKKHDHPGVQTELAAIIAARSPVKDSSPQTEDLTDFASKLPKAEQLSKNSEAAMIHNSPGTGEEEIEDWASQFDWGDLHIDFKDVAGLQEVKNQINLRIIAPLKQPEVFQAFGRTAGGGILLYGPPGCGKTFLAKATAGECGARFVSIGIHEIIDKYWGESEKMIHALFEEARRKSPTVLFFDEFDALGGSRSSSESQFWKTMVNQLLQEMDGIGGNNDNLLVFAATNLPWNVDSAFRRPGRFDRSFFVPPPDTLGRVEILEKQLKKLPGGDQLNASKLAKATKLMTGADLAALCERASERALERSLVSGKVHPVNMDDFKRALANMSSTALEWLATAKNYAQFSNQGGQFDDLAEFLKKQKKW